MTALAPAISPAAASRAADAPFLDDLEAEAMAILREVGAEFRHPALMFSGGKDSIVMVRLAEKAFRPGAFPFPLLHIDTGHNFPETLEFRDRLVERLGERLIVRKVQDLIDAGRAFEDSGPIPSRNRAQIPTLLEAVGDLEIDCLVGGARRDEEKARAKERIFSIRDDFGRWDPRRQRPELWNLYNTRLRPGEHMRVFPLSNWTELDVWQYIAREGIEIPSLYFSHEREVVVRQGKVIPTGWCIPPREGDKPERRRVRFRTIGDMTCSAAVESEATSINDIVAEIAGATTSERGGRIDDTHSDTAMEDRKREGYF
jgi:sulfate adenylyltransferase subunit 2